MNKVKRDRSAKISLNERDILVSLMRKYQRVLQNKQSDSLTWNKKDSTWESIQNEHPALIANVLNKTRFDELTRAKLELVQLQKELLEAEFIEKRKLWKFEENERKKEAEFKEKERKWKEEDYKLKLKRSFK